MKHETGPWTVGICLVTLWGGAVAGLPETAHAGLMIGDKTAVVRGNSEFAFDLYDRIRTEEGNLFLSPYSISTALAMTYAGARGETERQMADVLHFTLDPPRLHPAFAGLVAADQHHASDAGNRLHVANALWGQKGYGFLDSFLALNNKHYKAGLRELDFVRATEKARKTINEWVEENTHNMIRELLKQNDLDPSVALVLTNAIYFKGRWATMFDREKTADRPFHVSPDETVTVPMMSQVGAFAFASTDDVNVLELPYDGEDLSMILILPKARDGLPAVEASLNAERLAGWLNAMSRQNVYVWLPRFTLEWRLDLVRVLKAMGMTDACCGRADFSGMTGHRGLFISNVIHQARVEVNEEGTEAAAATAVIMKREARPPAFHADHPFLFLIRNQETGSILFLGRVVKPQ